MYLCGSIKAFSLFIQQQLLAILLCVRMPWRLSPACCISCLPPPPPPHSPDIQVGDDEAAALAFAEAVRLGEAAAAVCAVAAPTAQRAAAALGLGGALRRLGLAGAAAAPWLWRVLELEPDGPAAAAAWAELGLLAVAEGRPDEALECQRQLARLSRPLAPPAHAPPDGG